MISDFASIAVVGGSGLYSMPELTDTLEVQIETPFGNPSAPIIIGTLEGIRVAFLARHGIGHTLAPSEVPYRANIFALKKVGVERVISISACGSLRSDYAPGDIVIPDQLFDHTTGRARSFFGNGLVGHISVANPFCEDLSRLLVKAVIDAGAVVHSGGSFITIEGPRFSTRAESNLYRSWGMSIIGMTACPEAFLAREAEMCYSTMAHVTDYDVWHVEEKPVTVEMVIQTLNKNTATAQRAIRNLVTHLPATRLCDCGNSLATALITDRKMVPPDSISSLKPLIGKYLS